MDTNVPIVANGRSTAEPDCVLACTRRIGEVVQRGHVVVDDAWRIVGEYMRHLDAGGQPGPGDAFLKWLLTNLTNPARCTQVRITPLDEDRDDFVEFPDELRKVGFDRADRKFVAVAVADGHSPEVLQGFDSKWWGWRKDLERAGVTVIFLCKAAISRKYDEKSR